jgi:hypothetical protein
MARTTSLTPTECKGTRPASPARQPPRSPPRRPLVAAERSEAAVGDARGERHSLVQPSVKLWPVPGSELDGSRQICLIGLDLGSPASLGSTSLGRGEWPGRYAPRSAVSAAAGASRPPSPSPAPCPSLQARHDGDLRFGHRRQLRDSPHRLSPKRPMTSPEAGHRGWVATGVDPVTSLSGIDVCRPAPGGDSIRPGAGRGCPPAGSIVSRRPVDRAHRPSIISWVRALSLGGTRVRVCRPRRWAPTWRLDVARRSWLVRRGALGARTARPVRSGRIGCPLRWA